MLLAGHKYCCPSDGTTTDYPRKYADGYSPQAFHRKHLASMILLKASQCTIGSKEQPMTMQVGMLGTDGVILAGDTRINRKPLSGSHAPWMSYDGPKIRIGNSGRVAISCAHDMQTANDVADAIFANMTHGDHASCEREIKEFGTAAAQGRDVECIVVFADPLPCLYFFQHVKVGETVQNQCQRIIGLVPSGDTQNPAVFWGMSYYKLLPIDQLKHLAACVVVAAGGLNSSIVGGFEIVFCTKDGCSRLDAESAQELQAIAKEKIRRIGELIMGEP